MSFQIFLPLPSLGPIGPKRLLVSLLLSMAVCAPVKGAGPSLFPGDKVAVRLNEPINSGKNRIGDRFHATIDQNVELNGLVILPKGAVVEGTLTNVVSSGRLRRRAEVTLEVESVSLGGRVQPFGLEPEVRRGPSHAKRDGKLIGGGALAGMAIGAMAAGGVGAAVGSVTGAAAGAGGAAWTGKQEVYIPSETILIFRVRSQFTPELP